MSAELMSNYVPQTFFDFDSLSLVDDELFLRNCCEIARIALNLWIFVEPD